MPFNQSISLHHHHLPSFLVRRSNRFSIVLQAQATHGLAMRQIHLPGLTLVGGLIVLPIRPLMEEMHSQHCHQGGHFQLEGHTLLQADDWIPIPLF